MRRRLAHERRGGFAIEGSNWFVRPVSAGERTEAAWRRDVALLVAEHRLLRAEVARLDPATLERQSLGSRFVPLGLIQGIAAHDGYRAGQIQLLKRLVVGPRR